MVTSSPPRRVSRPRLSATRSGSAPGQPPPGQEAPRTGLCQHDRMDVDSVAAVELDGLDPYQLMARETERIDAFASTLAPDAWQAPTTCDGWSRADLMAHLAGSEEYNRACLDDTLGELFERATAEGVADVN